MKGGGHRPPATNWTRPPCSFKCSEFGMRRISLNSQRQKTTGWAGGRAVGGEIPCNPSVLLQAGLSCVPNPGSVDLGSVPAWAEEWCETRIFSRASPLAHVNKAVQVRGFYLEMRCWNKQAVSSRLCPACSAVLETKVDGGWSSQHCGLSPTLVRNCCLFEQESGTKASLPRSLCDSVCGQRNGERVCVWPQAEGGSVGFSAAGRWGLVACRILDDWPRHRKPCRASAGAGFHVLKCRCSCVPWWKGWEVSLTTFLLGSDFGGHGCSPLGEGRGPSRVGGGAFC